MKIYCFSSKNITNIWAGIGAKKWAVGINSIQKTYETKSKNMNVGSMGVIYCTETQCFTMPFVVLSKPKMDVKIDNIWPETWILPFSIHPLGNPNRMLSKDTVQQWIKDSNWNHIFGISPTQAFSSSEIPDDLWEKVILALSE